MNRQERSILKDIGISKDEYDLLFDWVNALLPSRRQIPRNEIFFTGEALCELIEKLSSCENDNSNRFKIQGLIKHNTSQISCERNIEKALSYLWSRAPKRKRMPTARQVFEHNDQRIVVNLLLETFDIFISRPIRTRWKLINGWLNTVLSRFNLSLPDEVTKLSKTDERWKFLRTGTIFCFIASLCSNNPEQHLSKDQQSSFPLSSVFYHPESDSEMISNLSLGFTGLEALKVPVFFTAELFHRSNVPEFILLQLDVIYCELHTEQLPPTIIANDGANENKITYIADWMNTRSTLGNSVKFADDYRMKRPETEENLSQSDSPQQKSSINTQLTQTKSNTLKHSEASSSDEFPVLFVPDPVFFNSQQNQNTNLTSGSLVSRTQTTPSSSLSKHNTSPHTHQPHDTIPHTEPSTLSNKNSSADDHITTLHLSPNPIIATSSDSSPVPSRSAPGKNPHPLQSHPPPDTQPLLSSSFVLSPSTMEESTRQGREGDDAAFLSVPLTPASVGVVGAERKSGDEGAEGGLTLSGSISEPTLAVVGGQQMRRKESGKASGLGEVAKWPSGMWSGSPKSDLDDLTLLSQPLTSLSSQTSAVDETEHNIVSLSLPPTAQPKREPVHEHEQEESAGVSSTRLASCEESKEETIPVLLFRANRDEDDTQPSSLNPHNPTLSPPFAVLRSDEASAKEKDEEEGKKEEEKWMGDGVSCVASSVGLGVRHKEYMCWEANELSNEPSMHSNPSSSFFSSPSFAGSPLRQTEQTQRSPDEDGTAMQAPLHCLHPIQPHQPRPTQPLMLDLESCSPVDESGVDESGMGHERNRRWKGRAEPLDIVQILGLESPRSYSDNVNFTLSLSPSFPLDPSSPAVPRSQRGEPGFGYFGNSLASSPMSCHTSHTPFHSRSPSLLSLRRMGHSQSQSQMFQVGGMTRVDSPLRWGDREGDGREEGGRSRADSDVAVGLVRDGRRGREELSTHRLMAAKSLPRFHSLSIDVGFQSPFDDFPFSPTRSTSEMTDASLGSDGSGSEGFGKLMTPTLDGGGEGRVGVCGERNGRDDEPVTPIFEVKRNTSPLSDRRMGVGVGVGVSGEEGGTGEEMRGASGREGAEEKVRRMRMVDYLTLTPTKVKEVIFTERDVPSETGLEHNQPVPQSSHERNPVMLALPPTPTRRESGRKENTSSTESPEPQRLSQPRLLSNSERRFFQQSFPPTSSNLNLEQKGTIRSHLSTLLSISLHPHSNLAVTTSNDNRIDFYDLTTIVKGTAGGNETVGSVCHYLAPIDDPSNPARPTASVFLPAIYSDYDIARGYPKYKDTFQTSPNTQPSTDITTVLKRYLSPSETVDTLKSCLGCVLVGDSQGYLALYPLPPTNYRNSSRHESLNSQLMTRHRVFDLVSNNRFSRDNGIVLMDAEEMGRAEYQPGIPSMRVVCVTQNGTVGLFVVAGTHYSVTGLQSMLCRGSIKRIALSSTKPTKDDKAVQVFFERKEVPSIVIVWRSGEVQQLQLLKNRLVLTKSMSFNFDEGEHIISSSFYPSLTKSTAISPTHLCILTNRSRVGFVDITLVSGQCILASLPASHVPSFTDKPIKIAGGHGGMILTMSTHGQLQVWHVTQNLSQSEPTFVMRGFSQDVPSNGSPNASTHLLDFTPIIFHHTSGFLIASTNSGLHVYKVVEEEIRAGYRDDEGEKRMETEIGEIKEGADGIQMLLNPKAEAGYGCRVRSFACRLLLPHSLPLSPELSSLIHSLGDAHGNTRRGDGMEWNGEGDDDMEIVSERKDGLWVAGRVLIEEGEKMWMEVGEAEKIVLFSLPLCDVDSSEVSSDDPTILIVRPTHPLALFQPLPLTRSLPHQNPQSQSHPQSLPQPITQTLPQPLVSPIPQTLPEAIPHPSSFLNTLTIQFHSAILTTSFDALLSSSSHSVAID
ncbi:hypothetical protein BLNAU_19316 [Blattamonas nauphoetae]|uniref:Uncharacterized protein n=1 Tax=Blattamonas nauphoetae TaxID=2049346 RepID=A0ABQ9X614_9EUKA|nr:hypothetical protein BLNAU_19316 [Blattamonas nauphoetae]